MPSRSAAWGVRLRSLLASLPDDELSPAALAARVTLREVAVTLVSQGH